MVENKDERQCECLETKAKPNPVASPVCPSEERLLLSYYDKEIKRRTKLLVDRLLIAHGNLPQLVLEQTGYIKKYNFSRVKRTRKTLGGGIFARQWLAVYSEAMRLGLGVDEDELIEDDMSEDGSVLDGTDDGVGMSYDEQLNDVNLVGSSPIKTLSINSSFDGEYDEDPAGPPKKIYMVRNDTDDDGMSTDGWAGSSIPRNSERQKKRSRQRKKSKNQRSRMAQKRHITSLNHASVVADKPMVESIDILKSLMQCTAPIRLLLDIKSRHVPRRVWARIIDCLRDSGAKVEGVASFIVEEVRDISQYCNTRVNEIVFTHSAGDMQQGCHSGLIRRGDQVFFNAGSLLWDYPDLSDLSVWRDITWRRLNPYFDQQEVKEGYCFKPYARILNRENSTMSNIRQNESESETFDDGSTLGDDESSMSVALFTRLLVSDRIRRSLCEIEFAFEDLAAGCTCSTIQEYKEHYHLSIGLYVQEFAIDEVAISLLVKYVNSNLHVFDLGLSWGGINGLTVKGIQPGRFTATDGFWNQRYGGLPWKKELKPGSIV